MVGRFSYSPQAGHVLSPFGAWWGDSFTRPRMDISHYRSVHGGEILLLTPGWTSHIFRRMVGRFSYSFQAGHLSSSFDGGAILLLAPGWTSLVVIWHVVGRFSYLPQAGHLSVSFGAWWGDSLTHPRLEISYRCLVCSGEILLLAPGWTSLGIV